MRKYYSNILLRSPQAIPAFSVLPAAPEEPDRRTPLGLQRDRLPIGGGCPDLFPACRQNPVSFAEQDERFRKTGLNTATLSAFLCAITDRSP